MPENLSPERASIIRASRRLINDQMVIDELRKEAATHSGCVQVHLFKAATAFDNKNDRLAEDHISVAITYCGKSSQAVDRIKKICAEIKEYPGWMR